MEVSMLRLAWLSIAQHVFQPALTGRLELISRKIVSSEQEQRLSRCADFAKKCLPRIQCKELPRFREKYRALGLQNSRNRWAKKWGPTCDCDISNSTIYTTTIYRAYNVSCHKLGQNDDFVSKYPSSVAAILKPRFRDHMTPIFQPTPISELGP